MAGLLFGKPKAPPAPNVPPPVVQKPNTQVADALASRRGSAANKLSGPTGGEAGGGLKTKLGQ